MKSVFSRMAAVALTMWLGFAAGTANAAIFTISSGDWSGSATTGYTANIGNNAVTGPVFSDWFNFSLPADTVGQGGATAITSITTSGIGVVFTVFDLWETTAGLISTNLFSLPSPLAALTFTGGFVPGDYHLNVQGYELLPSAGYGGTISTTPVPEPETYAMLLAGLGLIGFTARRRKQNA